MTEHKLPFENDALTAPSVKSNRQVFTVAELTAKIRVKLESDYPVVWVEGELSNGRRWKTGHLYFTLKDGTAQIRGVMFRSALRSLRFEPEDGINVVIRGRVSVYEPKGEYQLVAEHIEPHGIGARQFGFDQLRRKLEDEGLFDPSRKQPLPTLPSKIAIVTSLDGAALHDVMTVLGRRFPTAHLVISPTRVQGEDAAQDIVTALTTVTQIPGVDVVILTRGGGSVEDLWAFNDERVARAIAATLVPVISAVGHETDTTMSDFVADLRAPTPSAGAELVVAKHAELTVHIAQVTERLQTVTRLQLQRRRSSVDRTRHRPGFSAFATRLALEGRRIDELAYRLSARAHTEIDFRQRHQTTLRLRLESLNLGRQLSSIRHRFEIARQQIGRAITDVRHGYRHHLDNVVARLESLSPLGVLARGFAICWNEQRTSIIRTTADVTAGDIVRVKLHDGELNCEVKES